MAHYKNKKFEEFFIMPQAPKVATAASDKARLTRPKSVYALEANSNANALRIKIQDMIKLAALTALTIFAFSTIALACTNPAGVAGDMVYNDSEHVMQWCDGTDWIGVGTSPYIPNAVYFDGTNDTINTSTSTGPTSSTTWTGSFWVKHNGSPGIVIYDKRQSAADDLRVDIDWTGSARLRFLAQNSSSTTALRIETNAIPPGDWHHVLYSFDLTNASNRHIYIDDISAINTVTTYNTSSTMDFSAVFEGIGGTGNSAGTKSQNEIADFWMDFDTYLDLSDVSIRRQFIDASGFPVDLGSDGSRPTGTTPDIFLSGDTATWHINDGTGGGFTEVGALTDALSNPGENLGPTAGLVSWWKLDETSGITIVDSAGSNNGTMNGGLDASNDSVDGIIDKALDCDGADDYIDSSVLLGYSATDDFSYSVWFKTDNISNVNDDIIIGVLVTGGVILAVEIDRDGSSCNDDELSVTIRDDTSSGIDRVCGNFGNDTKWHHAVFTYDVDGNMLLYIDGVQVDTDVVNNTTNTKTTTAGDELYFCAANFNGTANEFFNGVIEDIRSYDRVLSPAEVTALYNTGRACQNPDGFRGGDVMYNTTDHVPQFCNLRQWKAMGASAGDGGAGCSNPIGEAGDFSYNTTSSIMTYCEGDDWKPVGVYN